MSALIEITLRGSLVLAAGFATLWFLRRHSASLRHWVIAIAVALAALQPAIRPAVPEWNITPLVNRGIADAATTGRVSTDVVVDMVPTPAAAAIAYEDTLPILIQLWLAGIAVGIGVLAFGVIWLLWQRAGSIDPGGRWSSARDSIARGMGIRVVVRLRETRHPALLVTWGMWRPEVLLPKGASAWPEDRIRLVLAHELAHLARRDWFVQLLAEVARTIYWPNPLFWLACARLRIESERACDDVVLGFGVTGTSYADHLIDLARSFSLHGRTWLPAPSIARPSTLERRVVAMLNSRIDRRPVSMMRKVMAAIVLAAIALPVAAASHRAGSPSGVLRDPSGRVLPGATVRLSAIGVDAIHETQTDSTGAFQFPEIPDGDYMLSGRLPGFLSARTRIRVHAGMAPLDFMMQVGSLRETISVKAGAPEVPPSPSAVARPAAPQCGTTSLGGNLKPPRKLRDVRPRYKQAWIDNNIEGEVLLQATIDADGKVGDVFVVSPVHADLEEEAVTAVSQWEFTPTYLNCAPIPVRIYVTVSFKIER